MIKSANPKISQPYFLLQTSWSFCDDFLYLGFGMFGYPVGLFNCT